MAKHDLDSGNNKKVVSEEQEASEAPETEKPQQATSSPEATDSKRGNWFKRVLRWLGSHKKFSIPLVVVVVLGVLAAIPQSRYGLAGLVIKQSYQVLVVDTETHKPVSEATIVLDGKKTTTDGAGLASIRTNAGYAKLEVTKKYYHNTSREVVVPITKPSTALKVELKAEGRPVPVSVVNKISKQAVSGAVLSAAGAKAKTGKNGKATLVLPAGKKEIKVQLSGEGFNTIEATLTVTTEENKANTFELTPSGKLYFLSNQSGKLDLVKANLDGSDRKVVLPGTGKEDKIGTILLASRDWKYIALLSKRDGGSYAKLFLIEAATDKVTVMDEGNAIFLPFGWSGDRFIYSVSRESVNLWEAKRQALKSYLAPAKKITTLTETVAEGVQSDYASQYFGNTYVLDKEVVYVLNWGGYLNRTAGKQASLNSVQADGSQKKTIKSYVNKTIETTTAEFGEIYVQYSENNGKSSYDEYAGGKLTSATLSNDQFYSGDYSYYVVSPSGKFTLWSEFRDGKNTFFVGDEKGKNGKQIGASEDYNVYGWFSDDYLLLTKKGSEMHILPIGGLPAGIEASPKVSDYYKPNYSLRGYGYGYGG